MSTSNANNKDNYSISAICETALNRERRKRKEKLMNKENCNLLSNSAKEEGIKSTLKTRQKLIPIVNTPDIVLRKNYQEETEKNVRITPPFQKAKNSENSENCQNSSKDKNVTFTKDPCNLSFSAENLLEDLFIPKPKITNSISNYYTINTLNIQEEFLHPLLPYSKENDDIYKAKFVMNFIKRPEMPDYKTDSIVIKESRKRKLFEADIHSNSNIESKLNFTPQDFKRRKVSSCKKIYESVLTFHSGKEKFCFNVYDDNAVGFDFRYNQILKHMEMDNDVETDDDQLWLANEYTLNGLKDAIENFSTRKLKNTMKFKRSRSQQVSRHTK